MNASPTTLTVDQLCVSPFNVRENEEDNRDVGRIAASIQARILLGQPGLIYPLVVHPMRGNETRPPAKRKWGVAAGGRRYRAIVGLIERGELPADWPVDIRISDLPDAELIELSHMENKLRRDLRPYEEYMAIARQHKRGTGIDDIAAHFGQTRRWVVQHLRLANLAPEIFEAFKTEKLSLDNAKAFAATEDHEAQRLAWQRFKHEPEWNQTAKTIHKMLNVGDEQLEKLLRFVGEDVYRQAGGRYELDMFADEASHRGRVFDAALLRKLSEDRLQALRDRTREVTVRPDLKFEPLPPKNQFGQSDNSLEIFPAEEDGRLQLPDGDVIATIQVDDAGQDHIRFWWASRTAQARATKPAGKKPLREPSAALSSRKGMVLSRPADGAAIAPSGSNWRSGDHMAADQLLRDGDGLTSDGVALLRSLRRAHLREMLVLEAQRLHWGVALDAFVWAQLRMQLTRAKPQDVGMWGLVGIDADADGTAALVGESEYAAELERVKAWPAFTLPDLPEAFDAFKRMPWTEKQIAHAVLAGIALVRSLDADGYRVPVHDAIAQATGHADRVRDWWQPTAGLLNLFPNLKRLEIAVPFVGLATTASWAKRKSAEITAHVLKTLLGTSAEIAGDAERAAAERWVHPALRLGRAASADAEEVMEAAE